MKSSLHSLIHFLPSLLSHLQVRSPELDPILDNSLRRPFSSLYNPSALTTQKTLPLYCLEGLFTDPLPGNGCLIIAGVRFSGNNLPSRCLVVGLYGTIQKLFVSGMEIRVFFNVAIMCMSSGRSKFLSPFFLL
jgi:hypothetical protein